MDFGPPIHEDVVATEMDDDDIEVIDFDVSDSLTSHWLPKIHDTIVNVKSPKDDSNDKENSDVNTSASKVLASTGCCTFLLDFYRRGVLNSVVLSFSAWIG